MSSKQINWRDFWKQFDDPRVLDCKSDDIDETLKEIERKLNRKLLSGDQMMIIEALEDRIEELSRRNTIS